MTQAIEFFFDFASPYSYLAHSQLPALGAEVTVRPMQVLKVMKLRLFMRFKPMKEPRSCFVRMW